MCLPRHYQRQSWRQVNEVNEEGGFQPNPEALFARDFCDLLIGLGAASQGDCLFLGGEYFKWQNPEGKTVNEYLRRKSKKTVDKKGVHNCLIGDSHFSGLSFLKSFLICFQ